MPRLFYTADALENLASIADYISDASSRAAAETFAAALDQKCRHLASLPGTLGRERSELRPDVRSFAFGNYVIFFRYREDLFEVLSILDGRRDIEALFEQPSNDD